jgi:hypothetical protein
MTQKRNRKKPELSFHERLRNFSRNARATAQRMPPGGERDEFMLKARDGEAAARIDRWLSSPGLQGPK